MNAFTHFQISCALRRITVLQASIQLIVLSIRASYTVRCVYILRLMLHAAKREATKRFLRRTFHIFSKYMEVNISQVHAVLSGFRARQCAILMIHARTVRLPRCCASRSRVESPSNSFSSFLSPSPVRIVSIYYVVGGKRKRLHSRQGSQRLRASGLQTLT